MVIAAHEGDRAGLEAHRRQLNAMWAAAVTRTPRQDDADDAALHFRWSQLRERIKGHVAELQERTERRRGEHDARTAGRRADQAERDAAEAVEFAVLALNGALVAVVDAALARAEAEEPAASG